MAFVSQGQGTGGSNWSASAWTVQDLEIDPTGNTIYATGVVTTQSRGQSPVTQTLNNQGWHRDPNNHNQIVFTPPLYALAEAKACLNDLILQLSAIGKST